MIMQIKLFIHGVLRGMKHRFALLLCSSFVAIYENVIQKVLDPLSQY